MLAAFAQMLPKSPKQGEKDPRFGIDRTFLWHLLTYSVFGAKHATALQNIDVFRITY